MDAFSDIKPVPLEVIASWPTPNYTNPERRGPALIIVNSILLPLALIVVGLRLYTRLRISRSAGWDDIFIALATVSLKLSDRSSRLLLTRLLIPTIGLTISVCLAAGQYSWDVHVWDVPPKDIVPSRQVTFAAQFLFVWATNFTKLSILFFYRRISSPTVQRILHFSVWATICFVILYTISTTIALITACSPVRAFWDITIPHRCDNERSFELAVAIINIIVDLVIIVLPLPTVWNLRLPKRQKWALSCIFMLGILVCIAGIIRVYYVNLVVNLTYDVTWHGYTLWIFVALEVDIALICASAPAMKPLLLQFFKGVSSNHSRGNYLEYRQKTSGSLAQSPARSLKDYAGSGFSDPLAIHHITISDRVQRPLEKAFLPEP